MERRKELKMALLFFALNATAGHLFSLPEFIRGVLVALSFTSLVAGLLPDTIYLKLKNRQLKKRAFLNGAIGNRFNRWR